MSIIKVENLTYIYSPGTPFAKAAIEDMSIDIKEGKITGVIGHTGSGKSTLIQHFNGLLKPTSGKIYFDGEDIWKKPKEIRKLRFKVGLVFQYPEYQLFEETVYKDIGFGPKNMGLNEDEIDKRIKEAAVFTGLSDEILKKSPFDLSGGQKRRVAIAGVIAMRPQVLILDEPAAGLDPKGRDKILSQIKEYHGENNNTVILVSHSMEDIAKHADEVLVLNKAKVFMQDTPDAVFSKADEIKKIGLNVPQITSVFNALKAKGFNINTSIYSPEQAASEIMAYLKKGGKPC